MKLQALGRYRLDNEVLGKGNFARVELATHSVLNAKVSPLERVYLFTFKCMEQNVVLASYV